MPMPANRTSATVFAAAIAAMLPFNACWAAGPWITESGGADTGMAGAGRAALALDAASLAANPAAIGALPGDAGTVAATAFRLDYTYRGAADTPAQATNHEGVAALPAAFAVHRAGRLTYGLGAYSYLGLSFDSGNEWAGRRAVEQAGLATYNIGPGVAWSVNDRLTLGASVAAQWAEAEIHLALANDGRYYGPPMDLPDGQLKLTGDSWAAAGQLGATYQTTRGLRLGAAWTAPVDHSMAFDIEASDVHPALEPLLPPAGTVRLRVTLPQQLLLGVSHESAAGTLVSLGLNWQDWSALGDAELKLPGQSTPIFPFGLCDTWGAAIGVRHRIAGLWTASAGVNYESSPATNHGTPAYFPVSEQWRLAVGVERSIADALRLRAALSTIFQGDAEVVQVQHPLPLPGVPSFTGTYEGTRVYLVTVAADFRL